MRFLRHSLVTLLLLALGAFLWVALGRAPISALEPHSAPVEWLLSFARERALERRVSQLSPRPADALPLGVAVGLYETHCAACHGSPASAPTASAQGLMPLPPALDGGGRRTTPERDFVILAEGLRWTAMPAYEITLSDDEIWALVRLLENLPVMGEEGYLRMLGETKLDEEGPPAASLPAQLSGSS